MSSPEIQGFIARARERQLRKNSLTPPVDSVAKPIAPHKSIELGLWETAMHTEANTMGLIQNMKTERAVNPNNPRYSDERIAEMEQRMRAEVATMREWMEKIGPDAKYGEYLALKNGLPRNHFFEGLE